MQFEPATLVALLFIVILAGFVQGVVGFAFGMVSMALSTILLDARTASILIAPLALTNISIVLWSVRRAFRWQNTGSMMIGMVMGQPLGLVVLLGGSVDMVRTLIALMLIYTGASRLYHHHNNTELKPLSRWVGFVAGITGGVLGGATNIGGPPVIAYSVRQPWSPEAFKAGLLSTFVVGTLVKVTILLVHGALSEPLLLSAGALIPGVIIGSLLGIRLFNRIDAERFARLVAVLVVLLGVWLLF